MNAAQAGQRAIDWLEADGYEVVECHSKNQGECHGFTAEAWRDGVEYRASGTVTESETKVTVSRRLSDAEIFGGL